MSNSSIYKKIEEKALKEAQEIKNQGIKKAEDARAFILQEATDRVNKMLSDIEAKNAEILKTKITEFSQAIRQKTLACKKEIISEVFTLANNKLLELGDDDFINLVIKLIKDSDIKGNETIIVSKNEYDKYLRLFSDGKDENNTKDLAKLNKLLKGDYDLRLSNEFANINGGFIITSENYDVDNSYETIIGVLAKKMETETANLLFGSKGL